MSPAEETERLLKLAGVDCGGKLVSFSPIDGKPIGRVTSGDPDLAASRAADAFIKWRRCPRRDAGNSSGCSASGCASSSRFSPR